jgi:hypothetical protein
MLVSCAACVTNSSPRTAKCERSFAGRCFSRWLISVVAALLLPGLYVEALEVVEAVVA